MRKWQILAYRGSQYPPSEIWTPSSPHLEEDSQNSIKDCLLQNMRKEQVIGLIPSPLLCSMVWSLEALLLILLSNSLEMFGECLEGPFYSFTGCCMSCWSWSACVSAWLILFLSAWDLQGKASARPCSMDLIDTVSNFITVLFMVHMRHKTLACEGKLTAVGMASLHGICDA